MTHNYILRVSSPRSDNHNNVIRNIGNGIHLGNGLVITAKHVVNGARVIEIIDASSRHYVAKVLDLEDQYLASIDIVLLQIDRGFEAIPAAVISRADRWADVQVAGIVLLENATYGPCVPLGGRIPNDGTLSASRSGQLMLKVNIEEIEELFGISESGRDSSDSKARRLSGLSGSGVYNAAKGLVGIVTDELTVGNKVASILFQPVNHALIKQLQIVKPLLKVANPILSAWNRCGDPYANPEFVGRERVLGTLATRFGVGDYSMVDSRFTGVIAIVGGAKSGKSSIMSELVKRHGHSHCAWYLAGGSLLTQADKDSKSNSKDVFQLRRIRQSLASQVAYLMGVGEDAVSFGSPFEDNLEELILAYSDGPRPILTVYLDAIDELGVDLAEVIPDNLLGKIRVVISLRRVDALDPGIVRRNRNVNILDLDARDGTPAGRQSIMEMADIQNDAAETVRAIWLAWEKSQEKALDQGVRDEIDKRCGTSVGLHAFCAQYLSANINRGSLTWISTETLPDFGDLEQTLLKEVLHRVSDELKVQYKMALGIVACAQEPLTLDALRTLAVFSDAAEVECFLDTVAPALQYFSTTNTVRAHHNDFNLIVQRRFRGNTSATCQLRLASDEMEVQDVGYYLRYLHFHLMCVIEGGSTVPLKREAIAVWISKFNDHNLLARLGSSEGVDVLLHALTQAMEWNKRSAAKGSSLRIDAGFWVDALTILKRDAPALRRLE